MSLKMSLAMMCRTQSPPKMTKTFSPKTTSTKIFCCSEFERESNGVSTKKCASFSHQQAERAEMRFPSVLGPKISENFGLTIFSAAAHSLKNSKLLTSGNGWR